MTNPTPATLSGLLEAYKQALPGLLAGALFALVGLWAVMTDPGAAFAHDPRECPPQDCAPCVCPPPVCPILEPPTVQQIEVVTRAMAAIQAAEEAEITPAAPVDTDDSR